MAKGTKYQARQPNEDGFIAYPELENSTWNTLITRQEKNLPNKACDEYMHGLELLDLPKDRIPQLAEVDEVLKDTTGWQTAQVPALISFEKFFNLLASKQFPVATFIRTPEELDYLQEPDIFHEIFGHCPLLTHKAFGHFTELYGKLGVEASKEDRVYLARLYWFTVEFGLLNLNGERRIYGGGILSSPGETEYAMFDKKAVRKPFDLIDVLRTPYRIDIMQPIYYELNSIDQLFEIADMDIMGAVQEAKQLGLFEPLFPPKEKEAS